MEKLVFAQANGRELNFVDKIFTIAGKANEMAAREGADKVINATIGSLLDDNGNLVVYDSVVTAMKNLAPSDFAAYAPIAGLPKFQEVVQKYAFGEYKPEMYTAAAATPGGTGAIRNSIANYSQKGDTILTSDWYWAAYKTIAEENYRKLDTYKLLTDEGTYNIAAFEEAVAKYMEVQDSLLVIINTPAHNPTGFSLTNDDWSKVIEVAKKYAVNGKKMTIFADIAYIDFTADAAKERSFFKLFESLPDSVLALAGYSASKGFTFYGMRCGALICMTNNEEICTEFKNLMGFSCRGVWSNGTRAAQQVLIDMYNDKQLKNDADKEREASKEMLLRRGRVFEEELKAVGVEMVPYKAGFFASIPCKDPDAVGEILQKEGIFAVPLAKGLRVALSSVTEEQCKVIAPAIKRAFDEFYGA